MRLNRWFERILFPRKPKPVRNDSARPTVDGYAFGQVIDHDLDLTNDGGGSMPISVAADDPIGPDDMPITPSHIDPNTGTSKGNQASICGTVFLDLNSDGKFAPREAGLAGFTVQLSDADGNVVGATKTDRNGHYVFDQQTGISGTGDYTVSLVLPDAITQTSLDLGPILISGGDTKVANANFGVYFTAGTPQVTTRTGIVMANPEEQYQMAEQLGGSPDDAAGRRTDCAATGEAVGHCVDAG
jgi:SdrD B-like domain